MIYRILSSIAWSYVQYMKITQTLGSVVATRDSTQVHQGQVQVQRGEAELYLDLAAVDLS